MTPLDSGRAITCLPFQLIEYGDAHIVRRGSTQIILYDAQALDVLINILTETSGRSITIKELLAKINPELAELAASLVSELIDKRILIPADLLLYSIDQESTRDVYYWTQKSQVEDHQFSIWLLGRNPLTDALIRAMSRVPIQINGIIDDPELTDDSSSDLINTIPILEKEEWQKIDHPHSTMVIGTLPYGGQTLLLEWNHSCIDQKIFFIPIIIEETVGTIGPIVKYGQGPCLQCLHTRQNAHLHNHGLHRHHEQYVFDGADISPLHPSMMEITAAQASFEIDRFIKGMNYRLLKGIIRYDFENSSCAYARVLKVPRCSCCSPLNHFSESQD